MSSLKQKFIKDLLPIAYSPGPAITNTTVGCSFVNRRGIAPLNKWLKSYLFVCRIKFLRKDYFLNEKTSVCVIALFTTILISWLPSFVIVVSVIFPSMMHTPSTQLVVAFELISSCPSINTWTLSWLKAVSMFIPTTKVFKSFLHECRIVIISNKKVKAAFFLFDYFDWPFIIVLVNQDYFELTS